MSRERVTVETSFPGAAEVRAGGTDGHDGARRLPPLPPKFPAALWAVSPGTAAGGGGERGRPGVRLLPLVMGSGLKGQRRVGSGAPGRNPDRRDGGR